MVPGRGEIHTNNDKHRVPKYFCLEGAIRTFESSNVPKTRNCRSKGGSRKSLADFRG